MQRKRQAMNEVTETVSHLDEMREEELYIEIYIYIYICVCVCVCV